MKKRIDGLFEIPVTINEKITIDFIFDSGCAELFMAPDLYNILKMRGGLDSSDFIRNITIKTAQGAREICKEYRLKSVTLGNSTIFNVEAIVSNSINASMLLGQNVLSRFGKIHFDYKKQELVIGGNNELALNTLDYISGYVVNENGGAIYGATVKLEEVSLTTVTDANGFFKFDIRDQGITNNQKVVVSIFKKGYSYLKEPFQPSGTGKIQEITLLVNSGFYVIVKDESTNNFLSDANIFCSKSSEISKQTNQPGVYFIPLKDSNDNTPFFITASIPNDYSDFTLYNLNLASIGNYLEIKMKKIPDEISEQTDLSPIDYENELYTLSKLDNEIQSKSLTYEEKQERLKVLGEVFTKLLNSIYDCENGRKIFFFYKQILEPHYGTNTTTIKCIKQIQRKCFNKM